MAAHWGRQVGSYRGKLLVVLSVGWLSVQFGRQILPPLLPEISEDLAISPFAAGVALTVLWGLYALAHYPGGHLSDTLSRKTVLVAAAVTLAAGFVILTVATVYPLFLVGAGVVGIGGGLYWISLRALLSDLFPDRRARAFGVQMGVGFVGPILAAGGAVAVLAIGPWNLSFVPIVVVLGVVLALSHRWIREPYVLRPTRIPVLDTARRVFGTPELRRIVLAYTLYVFAWQGVIGFLPTFLRVEKGFSTGLASLGFGLLFVVAIVVLPSSGALGDRIEHVAVAIAGLVVGALGLVAIILLESPPFVFLSIVVFAVGLWSFPAVMQAHLISRFPDASIGGDFGAVKTVYAGLGSLGPSYVGLTAGLSSYAVAYVGLLVCMVCCLALLATTRRDASD